MKIKWFGQQGQAIAPRKKYNSIGLSIGLGLFMLGCASTQVPAPPPTSGEAVEISNSGQSLPIAATVDVRGQTIQLEVAKTLEQKAMGLMFRPELDANRGMLFLFDPPRPVSFWMKNVLIDLDMVFLRNGKVIAIASNVPPCQAEPCPYYGPPDVVDQVIELRGGRAAELGLQAGDRMTVKPVK
jgi:hypothetical protein